MSQNLDIMVLMAVIPLAGLALMWLTASSEDRALQLVLLAMLWVAAMVPLLTWSGMALQTCGDSQK